MIVLRWRFEDPSGTVPEYTFPRNPRSMSTPFPARQVQAVSTTAPGGQILLWEGGVQPPDWTFGGTIVNAAHYAAMLQWAYDVPGRIFVWDHFGRRITCVPKGLDVPKEAPERVGHYWRHEYTFRALVVAVSSPTVGDDGPQEGS